MSLTLTTSALALLLAASASAQSVFVVAPVAGPGVFSTDIQPAVDAAANGDLVLVKAGSYSGFTINAKGVSVIADAGAAVVANGSVFVENISLSQRVLLQGLTVHGDSLIQAILAQNSPGSIWIESCNATGGTLISGPGIVGVAANSCSSLVIQRSVMTGGNGVTAGTVDMGGPALHIANSEVAVGDSQGFGGIGAPPPTGGGGFGGSGLRVLTGFAFASGSAFNGGAGAAPVPPFPGGPGGAGINPGAPVTTLQCTAVGGPGFPNGAATVANAPGSIAILPGSAEHFSITSPVREGQTTTITAGGAPGETAWLLFSPSPATVKLLLPFKGALVLPAGATAFALGVIPAGGTLSTPVVMPNLPAGLQSATVWCQSLFFPPLAHAVIGPSSALVILDAAL
jgi:hypothetical protein